MARRRSVRGVAAALAVAVGIPLAAGAPAPPAAAAATELFFSEYIEGNSNNKALEIYNGTPAPVDLAAGGYSLQMHFNGAANAGLTIPLTGTVASGDVHVVAHQSAGPAILAQADQTNGSGWFNGDDAVVLRRNGEVIDAIGQIGFDPGSQWGAALISTADNTLRRRPDVCAGDSNGSDTFDPATEWDGFAVDTFDGLGAHTSSCAGPVDEAPVASCPATLVTTFGTPTSAAVSATDDIDRIASIVMTSAPIEGIELLDIVLEAGSATLSVSGDTEIGVYDVVVEFTTAGDPAQSATCTVRVRVDPAGVSPISAVQGSSSTSPLRGLYVTIEGIVTSLFTSNDAPDGFFVQEEDLDADGDPNTSEGLFVFCRGRCPPDLAVGDSVTAYGPVSEFFGMTQVSSNASGGRATINSSANPLPSATDVNLPADGSTRAEETFEAVEGMVVRFPGRLAVSEYFELARYGQLVLTAEERPFQFTHVSAPSIGGYSDFLADLSTRRIILDDDNNTQNDAITAPDENEPYPWPQPGLSVTNRIRGGDRIEDLTGVLHWSFAGQTGTDAWRIRPIQGLDYEFTSANPPPAAPDAVGGELRVASFNVLNYFATIDTTSSNDSGTCGPSGQQDCRGADSEAERERQLDKIVAALSAIDADVVGLIEIENDEGRATQQIVDALNSHLGAATYAAIDTGFVGTDAIKVALIYRPGAISPVGEHAILDSRVDPEFVDAANRPALIQTFEEVATGERLTVAINHLKSKGSSCDDPEDGLDLDDPDLGDGAGNCNVTRTRAAQALADYLAIDPTGSGDPDHLILGDLNAYRMEDPITTLEAAGFTDLHQRFGGARAYTYLFDGQLGYLDHALANGPLLSQVTGATSWPINADEVPLFDYNDDVTDSGEAAFERESKALDLYDADALRSSDHDPVVVGLLLGGPERGLIDLRAVLAAMSVHHGVKRALDVKLDAALDALSVDDPAGACVKVQDFLDHVRAQRGKKITTTDADALSASADEIRILLTC